MVGLVSGQGRLRRLLEETGMWRGMNWTCVTTCGGPQLALRTVNLKESMVRGLMDAKVTRRPLCRAEGPEQVMCRGHYCPPPIPSQNNRVNIEGW